MTENNIMSNSEVTKPTPVAKLDPMQVREFQDADHATISRWWIERDGVPPPKAVLPKLGLIVGKEGKDIAAGFLYMDNSVGVCMLEWVVTNPDATAFESARAIRDLVAFMGERALEMDYGVMLTSCRQRSLARLYGGAGFAETDKDVIHMVKILRDGGNN